jgi:nitrous oxide reductase accessory protein NosL
MPARNAIAAVALLATAAAAGGAEQGPVVPRPDDKCPVCGMFVARYPDWIAGVRFRDGGHAVFDGAKDLFKFLLLGHRDARGRTAADVESAFVTDYYAVRQVEARAAWYVVGSDVLGPMGNELVPFQAEREAREFLADHGGKVLRYADVTPAILRGLD